MQRKDLFDLITSLSDEQQAVVEEFLKYLHTESSPVGTRDFRASLEDFIREHSELLKRLAQ
jgi:hypothetical protein